MALSSIVKGEMTRWGCGGGVDSYHGGRVKKDSGDGGPIMMRQWNPSIFVAI